MFALELPGRDGGGGGGGKKNCVAVQSMQHEWRRQRRCICDMYLHGAYRTAVSTTVSTRKTIGNAFNRDPTALKSIATICKQAIACYCRTVQNA